MRGRLARISVTFLLLLAASACGDDKQDKRPTVVFSPTGEPLTGGPLGRQTCEEASTRWFAKMSMAGGITETMFLADARRQFRIMDIDHDGLITPEELSRYRQPYAFGRHKGASPDDMDDPSLLLSKRSRDAEEERKRAAGDTYEDHADPVMSADRHNRNQVSLSDFLIYEKQNFATLNKAHDGRLTLPELLTSCEG